MVFVCGCSDNNFFTSLVHVCVCSGGEFPLVLLFIMSKVRIKFASAGPNTKVKILNIFNNFKIQCSKLAPGRNQASEFVAHCNSDRDADIIFGNDCTIALSAIDCSAIMPMKLKVKMSVLLKKLDDHIYDHTADEVKHEINCSNQNYEVVEVYKFPNSKTMKITFLNNCMAENCIVNGIKLFMLHISPQDIKREEYYEVKTCYKCFSLDSHFTHECQKEANDIICSKCAETGHSFRTCSSTQKKCINCQLSHPTLSFSCPKRKEIVLKMKNNTHSVQSSYSSVTKTSNLVAAEKIDASKINEMVVKSIMCLVVSTEKEKENPGCFDEVLETLQKINKVPDFKMGDISLPSSLLDIVSPNYIPKRLKTTVNQNLIDNDLLSNNAMTPQNEASSSELFPPQDCEVVCESLSEAHESFTNIQGASAHPQRISTSNPSTSTNPSTATKISTNKTKPKICISKYKSCGSINSGNLEKLYNEGQISFHNSQGMSPKLCLDYFQNNLLELKSAVSKAKILDPKTLRSGSNK